MQRALLAVACLGVLISAGHAQSPQNLRVVFDPSATTIEFTLGDVLHTVHGTFKMKSGSLEFDPQTGAASGLLVVDVSSGETGNSSRDRKMHREVLQSDRFPDATFTPRQVIGRVALSGASHVQVKGIFRIHGQDHDLALDVPVQVFGNEVQLRTQFVVPFVKWGMKDPSTFVLRVSKEVQMSISGTEHITPSAAGTLSQ